MNFTTKDLLATFDDEIKDNDFEYQISAEESKILSDAMCGGGGGGGGGR